MKTLTCSGSVCIKSNPVPFEQLKESELHKITETWSSRLSNELSRYYSNHPVEYAAL